MNIVITKKGEKYYFTSEGNVYELNEKTMGILKVELTLPVKVIFRDCPLLFIGNFISDLFDEAVEMSVSRIGNSNDYEASFAKTNNMRM